MDFCERPRFGEIDRVISEGIQMCPFLRNIRDFTDFSFAANPPPTRFPNPVRGNRGPIFEDGPNFDLAFQLFHGKNGVIPLTRKSPTTKLDKEPEATANAKFHPLAASAAAISLSSLGGSGPFSFDAFMAKRNLNLNKDDTLKKKKEQQQEKKPSSVDHEASSNEWLQTGNCPIAKSFRAMSGVLPLVTKALQPPKDMKIRCPTAIVMARAALARTEAVKALRPQPLPARVLAVGMLGIALNVPLGVWREHTKKFSPAWFVAVHASVPFIAMLRKAVHMPKHVMLYTFAASILGQVIGSRAERRRIELSRVVVDSTAISVSNDSCISEKPDTVDVAYSRTTNGTKAHELSVVNAEMPGSLQCGKEVCSSFFVKPNSLLQV